MDNPGITGMTRLVGVIGWPVEHSRSPRMHNAAFAALDLNWAYLPLPVPPERVGEAVAGLRALGFAGSNVTVPHKQAVMGHVDELTEEARGAGAVNTIVVRRDGSLLGETTDGYGFSRDLAEHGVELPTRALLIGSGGAARSLVFALAAAGCETVICARNTDRAEALCQAVAAALPQAADRLSVKPFPAGLRSAAGTANLVVNATSLGLREEDPLPWDPDVPFHRGQVAYDLVYHRSTSFLQLASSQGARAIGGLGMLVHQGARSFEMWTGMPAPVDAMRAAVANGLATNVGR